MMTETKINKPVRTLGPSSVDTHVPRHIPPTADDPPNAFANEDRLLLGDIPPPSAAPTRELATPSKLSSSRTASALARLSAVDVNHGSCSSALYMHVSYTVR